VQARRVDEGELAEILRAHEAALEHLVGFRHHLPEVGHVEVGEVRAEDRVQPRAEALIERPHRGAV